MNWLTLLFESDGNRGEDMVVLVVVETVIKIVGKREIQ
jgi:hypothetical protein